MRSRSLPLASNYRIVTDSCSRNLGRLTAIDSETNNNLGDLESGRDASAKNTYKIWQNDLYIYKQKRILAMFFSTIKYKLYQSI